MNRATPQMRSLAEQLIAFDASKIDPSASESRVTFRVINQLRPHLATLMGDGGFRALLSRALVLATAEDPSLAGISMRENGTLGASEAPHSESDPAEFLEGRVILVAQLLGLLEAFIGPMLASHIVGEVWPEFPLSNRDFGKEARNEDAS
jgi:hypothetical protein